MYDRSKDKEVIKDYQEGMSWENICKKYNTNTNTIHKVLIRNNINKNRLDKLTWPPEKIKLFKDMYLSNCTYNEMYEALNCKGGTLTYWVHKLHLPMRGSGRNNTCYNKFKDRNIFSDYWLGYIFADGHVQPNVGVTLASEKEYVITKYKQWFGEAVHIYTFNYALKSGETKKMYQGTISSRNIAKYFNEKLNIEGKKHHTLNPNIEINWDIVRGFFDGDGSSSKKEFQLKSCSKVWLERIQKFLNEYGIESVLKLSYLDCYGLYVRKKDSLKILVRNMYKHPYFCHQYKLKNFENLL